MSPREHRFAEPAALDRLVKLGGLRLLDQMIELIQEVAPERIAAARNALAAGDRERARRAAHSLKSSAGNLGLVRLRALAEEVETAAAADEQQELSSIAAELPQVYQESLRALRMLREGMEEAREPEA